MQDAYLSSKLESPFSQCFTRPQKKKNSFNEACSRHVFWSFLKKHKACLDTFCYFIAKNDMDHQNELLDLERNYMDQWFTTQPLSLRCCITQFFLKKFTCHKIWTRLIYNSCSFGLWLLDVCWLNHIHHLIITIIVMYFYKRQENYIKYYV